MFEPPPRIDLDGPQIQHVQVKNQASLPAQFKGIDEILKEAAKGSKELDKLIKKHQREAEREARREAEREARREAAREVRREAARRVPNFLKAAREAGSQDAYYTANLDKSGDLWIRAQDSQGKMIGQPLMIGNVWDALAEGGIDIRPKGSEVVRFRIGEEIEVAATVKLHVGFFGGRTLLLPSFQIRWLSLEERVADWDASLGSESGIFRIIYRDSNAKTIHEDGFNVYDVLAESGTKLRPKGSTVIRFALGADLMEATLELEVGFLGFSRKLKLLSVKRKRGEAWRLSTPEKETP